MKKIKTIDTILCYKVSTWIASDYKFIVFYLKSFVYFSMHIPLPLRTFIKLIFEEKLVWNKANIFSIWMFCEFVLFFVHSNAFRVKEIWEIRERRKSVSFENSDENQFPNSSLTEFQLENFNESVKLEPNLQLVS